MLIKMHDDMQHVLNLDLICTAIKTTVYKNSGRGADHAPPIRHQPRVRKSNSGQPERLSVVTH